MIITPFTAFASTSKMDITTSSVRDDLANMEMDQLSNLSSEKNIFLGMSQYYESEDSLRTYVYLNYIGSTQDKLTISISIATTDENYNITEEYRTYDLSFVNNDSTWVKYEVLGLSNLDKTTRRYNLKSISSTDVILDINETYIFHGITNDTIEVFNQEVETIEITEKEVHFFCYGEESGFYDFFGVDDVLGHNKKYTDAWYIFFNTDKEIDTLKEIEITYMPYDYHIQCLGAASMKTAFTEEMLTDRIENSDFDEETTITYGEQTVVTITPGTTKVSATDNFWGGYETKYQEIDNVMDLRKYDAQGTEENPFVFTDQAQKYTWGVNFLNTEKYSTHKGVSLMGQSMTSCVVDGTGVRNTAIIRLKYEINGMVKNAYVIDIPTDDFTGSAANTDIEGEDWWQKLVSIILGGFLLLLCWPLVCSVVKSVFKNVIKGVGFILEAVWNIFTIPIRLIFNSKRK